jgi:arylsulfatase A-like enzyme
VKERKFAASITRMDSHIGKLFDLLKKKGIDENTLVIFTSDNGPHKEGGHDPAFFQSSGPLRGTKRDLYDGGVRVPSIVRWPGKVPAGKSSEFVWAFWDFLPTAAELAGVAAPSGLDGISVVDGLTGKKATNRRTLYWEFHEGIFSQGIRRDNWKLIRQGRQQKLELYDVAEDIGEKRNLAADKPAVVKELEPLFASMRTDNPRFPVKRR